MLLLSVGKTPDINSQINESKVRILDKISVVKILTLQLTELYTNVSPDDHTRQAHPR